MNGYNRMPSVCMAEKMVTPFHTQEFKSSQL